MTDSLEKSCASEQNLGRQLSHTEAAAAVRYLEFAQEGQGQVHSFVEDFFAEQLCCNDSEEAQ